MYRISLFCWMWTLSLLFEAIKQKKSASKMAQLATHRPWIYSFKCKEQTDIFSLVVELFYFWLLSWQEGGFTLPKDSPSIGGNIQIIIWMIDSFWSLAFWYMYQQKVIDGNNDVYVCVCVCDASCVTSCCEAMIAPHFSIIIKANHISLACWSTANNILVVHGYLFYSFLAFIVDNSSYYNN